MSQIEDKTNVLLPSWIFKKAQDKEHLKDLDLQYMKRYPEYRVKSIKNGFAICIKS